MRLQLYIMYIIGTREPAGPLTFSQVRDSSSLTSRVRARSQRQGIGAYSRRGPCKHGHDATAGARAASGCGKTLPSIKAE